MYSLACEHFRHDLTQFWNHSSFFALLQGGLISVAVTSLGPQDKEKAPGVLDPWQVAASIAVVGLLFAIFWCMVAGEDRYSSSDGVNRSRTSTVG